MTTSVLVVNGLQKLFKVMSYKNRTRKVCRIYDPSDVTIPEKLLNETIPGSGIFRDRINHLRFKHTREGMISI
jgi:hypothetical protein